MDGNSIFKNNSADNSGGAIKWDDIEPTNILLNKFINNSATIYGDNIGCFP